MPRGRLLKVVVAEDSDAYLLRIRAALSDLPVELVGTAKTSVEAISLIERFQPDLIVVDIFLLEGSGVDILHHLNTVGSRARRVVMTSEQSPELRSACLALGAARFLDKVDFILTIENLVAEAVIELADPNESSP
jgi:two-component system, OmpR family, response regulator